MCVCVCVREREREREIERERGGSNIERKANKQRSRQSNKQEGMSISEYDTMRAHQN